MRYQALLKRSLFSVVAIGMVGIISLALLEIILRVTGQQPDFFWEMNEDVGVIHIPGKRGWWVFADGRQFVEINSHGYRDVERVVEKPANTYRIALLGDSFVEALQVPQPATVAAMLEERLTSECLFGTKRYEVLNFGVSGFGTAQELETLRYRASQFAPDLVLLMFYASNDLFDNSRELDIEPNRLHYALSADNQLVRLPFSISDNPIKKWLRGHSKAYLFVRERIKRMAVLRQALTTVSLVQQQVDPEEVDRRRADRSVHNVQFLRQMPEAIERAWGLAAALLLEMKRLAHQEGAELMLVSIPNRGEIRNSSKDNPLDETWDYQQSQVRLRSICVEHDIRCLNLAPAFARQDAEHFYFPRDGHWTASGHQAASAEMFQWLSPSIPGCSPSSSPATPQHLGHEGR